MVKAWGDEPKEEFIDDISQHKKLEDDAKKQIERLLHKKPKKARDLARAMHLLGSQIFTRENRLSHVF